MPSWKHGDIVVLRYWGPDGPTGALPARVIEHDDNPVLWIASGTPIKWPAVGGRHVRDATLEERFTLPRGSIDREWTGDGIVIVGRPGRAHSIWLFWDDWRFRGWYLQLEEPWRAFALGYDTRDHVLDAWISAEGVWRWKDEHELDAAVAFGYLTCAQAASIRAEGERVRADWPFPTGWEHWQPRNSWPLPEVPSRWRD